MSPASPAHERTAGDGSARVSSRVALAFAAAVVVVAVAGFGLMKLGAELMRSQGEQTAISEQQYRAARVGAVTRSRARPPRSSSASARR